MSDEPLTMGMIGLWINHNKERGQGCNIHKQLLLILEKEKQKGIKISLIFGRLTDMIYCVTRWEKVMIVRKCLALFYLLAQNLKLMGIWRFVTNEI